MISQCAKCLREDFHLPFTVRSIGFLTLKQNESILSAYCRNNFVELYWCRSGKGVITLFEKEYLFEEQDVFWYLPGEDQKISAKTDNFSYIFLTITGPLASAILLSYHYPRLIKNAGPVPESILREIMDKISKQDLNNARHLTTLMMEILERAGRTKDPILGQTQIVERFITLVETSYADASLNINDIADRLGVHRTTLTKLVKQELKNLPSEYLLSQRITYGINLLRGTNLPISEVASSCGLPNVTYFDRVIRRSTGKTPTEIRLQRGELAVDSASTTSANKKESMIFKQNEDE